MNLLKVFILILSLLPISACLKEDTLNLPYSGISPKKINDGWEISLPTLEGIDEIELQKIYREVYSNPNLWSIRSMLVIKNNKLIAEAYMKDSSDIDTPRMIWSCTKQILGLISGIAVEQGVIKSVQDPMELYLSPEIDAHQDKKNITISDLLTMRSGIAFNNDGLGGHSDQMLRKLPPNSLKFILSIPIDSPPGLKFHYNDGNPHLISKIIQNQTGQTTDQWSRQYLFSKIGFTNYKWHSYLDGVTLGAFGIETTPRELAKIGQLVLNNGSWHGEQIVPKHWIESMISPHVRVENRPFSFGYFWWIDRENSIHFMNGHGGQFVFVVPSKNMVVVMTSIPNTQDDFQIKAEEVMPFVKRLMTIAQ